MIIRNDYRRIRGLGYLIFKDWKLECTNICKLGKKTKDAISVNNSNARDKVTGITTIRTVESNKTKKL